ncbi:IMPACT family protein [Dermacoccus nishinomiyaensis]|uniref:IMPACT family protein n=1 Tax=Dermacoccus nishinomiyaensis TaxID=1274 RepID=UPI0013F49C0F|nr:YigZ family protein [Dermacoccus nishinomiyaensis]MCG7428949.1 YigZ family protein [Dermacoccus nishinomiyaensis]NHC31266.1 YigZ family protein [Dermacoccus nishinomiyaensis]
MTTSRFTTLAGPAIAEIEVKRSRFLCELTPVGAGDDDASEVAARAVVEAARKQHWDARHHCSAFVLGPQRQVRRSNDDGEPSGTAGAPMLEALVASGLSDVVAVVTRWFGGTLLGAGGLVRAYGDVVRAALAEARVVTYEHRLVVAADVAIADVGRVENALRAAGRHVEGVDYAQGAAAGTARLVLAVTEADRAALESELASLTGSSADLDECGQRWVALADQPG